MTERSDISTGRLVYTCNCGWVDTGHANPTASRAYVGAASLWEQVVKETGVKSRKAGANGFLVVYRQDMGRKIRGRFVGTAVERRYYVGSGASLHRKESIAFAIFTEVSKAFEDLQSDWLWGRVTSSGYSEEDLVSNLIGFYKVVRPEVGKKWRDLCRLVSTNAALKVWDTFGAVGGNKNKSFTPNLRACDECTATPSFPKEFQTITAAEFSEDFRLWTSEDGA